MVSLKCQDVRADYWISPEDPLLKDRRIFERTEAVLPLSNCLANFALLQPEHPYVVVLQDQPDVRQRLGTHISHILALAVDLVLIFLLAVLDL